MEGSKILNTDIRYVIFRSFIIFTGTISLIFTVVHILLQRPLVNILTSLVSLGLCLFWFFFSGNRAKYTLSRISFLAVFSLVWLPLGYLTSPGSYSAMPYLVIMAAFMLTVIVKNPWEYVFPLSMVIQMPFLFRMEIWYAHLFERYTSEEYRINDLTMNFTVVILTVILTAMFLMRKYRDFNSLMYDLSIQDDLTGLYNKRYLMKALEQEKNRAERTGREFTLFFLDLDNFKKVNDNLGHMEGDRILQELSEILRNGIRNYDLAARYGGDEFILLFPGTLPEDGKVYMQRLEIELKEFCRKYSEFNLAVCWGMSHSRGKTPEEILSEADRNLYLCKAENRSSSR